jgi:pimeloyl-ACP methyl ester carboxylesterase
MDLEGGRDLPRARRPRQHDTDGLWDAVRSIRCPTLLINGAESDILGPEAAQKTVAAMARGRLATVPGAGHSVMGDNPEGFYRVVQAFLENLA